MISLASTSAGYSIAHVQCAGTAVKIEARATDKAPGIEEQIKLNLF